LALTLTGKTGALAVDAFGVSVAAGSDVFGPQDISRGNAMSVAESFRAELERLLIFICFCDLSFTALHPAGRLMASQDATSTS
jgi:hypothetical protein